MSLTYEQRYLLEELREYLKRVEKMAPAYSLDLDDFAVEYASIGYRFSPAVNIPAKERSAHRKALFEKSGKQEKINIYLPEEE